MESYSSSRITVALFNKTVLMEVINNAPLKLSADDIGIWKHGHGVVMVSDSEAWHE